MVGFSINLPIFSSGQRYSKVGQAKLALNKAQLAKEQATRGLNMEYLQSRDDFNTAWDKYLNSKSSLALAQKVLREVTIKFNNGLATSMDVTQANDKLLQSVGNLYSAEFDMLKAKLHLDKVTSNL
jgi:outer membrane protein TolC